MMHTDEHIVPTVVFKYIMELRCELRKLNERLVALKDEFGANTGREHAAQEEENRLQGAVLRILRVAREMGLPLHDSDTHNPLSLLHPQHLHYRLPGDDAIPTYFSAMLNGDSIIAKLNFAAAADPLGRPRCNNTMRSAIAAAARLQTEKDSIEESFDYLNIINNVDLRAGGLLPEIDPHSSSSESPPMAAAAAHERVAPSAEVVDDALGVSSEDADAMESVISSGDINTSDAASAARAAAAAALAAAEQSELESRLADYVADARARGGLELLKRLVDHGLSHAEEDDLVLVDRERHAAANTRLNGARAAAKPVRTKGGSVTREKKIPRTPLEARRARRSARAPSTCSNCQGTGHTKRSCPLSPCLMDDVAM